MQPESPALDTKEPVAITGFACAGCGKTQQAKRLPKRWKRRDNATVYCRDCWRARYILRALTLPVAEPLSGNWRELRDDLAAMWIETTHCANWMMTELYARDVRRGREEKMPPMRHVYLYPEARQLFPALTPQSVASLEQAVTRKYVARRYEVVWTHAASLASLRYPQPFPVHNQSWSLAIDEQRRPILSARIGAKRWEMRLQGGIRYRRQLAGLQKIVAGAAIPGEAAFYKHPDGTILAKLVVWLPRPATTEGREGMLAVYTRPDQLLVAVDTKDERVWAYNADHLRRWIAQYERIRQRLAEDQKAEQRPVPSFAGRREAMTLKQRRRMDSAIQQIAAQLAKFAQRRRFAVVRYNDADKSYLEKFPWFVLRERIAGKLDEYHIAFEHVASAAADAQKPQPLAEEQVNENE
jgi:hypothetical protein